MSITIRLSADEEKRLAERADRSGRDLTGYVHLLIERDIESPSGADEALAPFRRQVEESGLSDDDLGDFFEEVRDEVWGEKLMSQVAALVGLCDANGLNRNRTTEVLAMGQGVQELFQAALELSDEEQLQLVAALVAAVDERGLHPFDDSWLEEVRRRSTEYDDGGVKPIPWAEVKDRARREPLSRG
jgi:putative addiction module component (TIGR02574 family)